MSKKETPREEFCRLRKLLGTQAEVAQMLGCSTVRISRIETGHKARGHAYPVNMESIYALRYLLEQMERNNGTY